MRASPCVCRAADCQPAWPHRSRLVRDSGWQGRAITAYRPDPVVDPDYQGFAKNVAVFGTLIGEDTTSWSSYLNAHRQRRAFFKTLGTTSTDHGHPSALKLGPAWWFNDSPEGMRRFRQQTTETAGFYNTVGFNDDSRAFLSIPARHDMARRMD